jgi:hypothetical protein
MKTLITNQTACRKGILFFLSLIIFPCLVSFSQEVLKDYKVNPEEKKQVVDSIALFMERKYVFPDKGKEMGQLVVKNLKEGKYNGISDPQNFAAALTEDLRSVNHDRHIGVMYGPEMIAMMRKGQNEETKKEMEEYMKQQQEHVNFNFEEIKILPGNVGYLKFNSFMEASNAGPTAIAAMNFLAHTDALIIDLTDNGGGSPSLIQLITTYFFEEPEHINSFYIREGDKTDQFWTLTYVPGERMLETDIYILTSGFTFSGAEEFTYNLKNMKRAVIVGETTGGGAHPVERHIINDNFGISIPFGKAVNPITNSNWEGTGIDPDVKAEKSKALDVAYVLALDSLLKKVENEEVKQELAWAKEGLQAKLNPYSMDEKKLKDFVGVYGPRTITLEDGQLYYQRENRPKMKMIPMKEDMFMLDELAYFRIKFIREGVKVIAIEGQYDNGTTDRHDKL